MVCPENLGKRWCVCSQAVSAEIRGIPRVDVREAARGRFQRFGEPLYIAGDIFLILLYKIVHDVLPGAKPEDRGKITQEIEEEYKRIYNNPYKAASIQQVDEIIEPKQTRGKIYDAVRLFENKRETRPWKKHGNMPV